MAIHFVCVCGKHLKARHDMVSRITLCPACGEQVKVPTGEPTHRGVSRIVKAAPIPAADSERRPEPQEVLARGQRRSSLVFHREQPESGWLGSFLYTLPILPWLALLAAGLAITCGVVFDRLPAFLQSDSRRPLELEVFIPCVLAIPALLLCAAPLLSGVLALGIEGSLKIVSRPRFDDFLRSGAQWMACLAAGPALLLVGAAGYWIHCGDLEAVDWLIVVELLALGSGNLFAALIVTSPCGGFRRLHPFAILQVVQLLGWWFIATSLFAGGAILGWAYLVSFAVARLHTDAIVGTLWLGLGWFAALAALAFLFRRLGLWHYRASRGHAISGAKMVSACR
jgi:hypothetical protein